MPDIKIIDYDKSADNVLRQQNKTILLKTDDGRIALIAPSAKEKGKWQVTNFDSKGPIGDAVISRLLLITKI